MKKNFVKIMAIVLTLALAFCMVGCAANNAGTNDSGNSGNTGSTGSTGSTGDSKSHFDTPVREGLLAPSEQKYVFVNCNTASETSSYHKHGFEAKARELGVQFEYTGPTDGDETLQTNILEQVIATKPQGIIVHPCGESVLAVIDKAVDAGIPTVIVDNALPGSKALCSLSTGNFASGVIGGQRLVEELNGEGQVAFLYWVAATNLSDVVSGYKSVIADYPGIEVVAEQNCLYDAIEAANASAALMQAYPDLDAIVVVDGNSGAGVATAIREAGKIGQVKGFARDFDKPTLQGIKDGILVCTLGQKQALMGYMGLDVLYSHYNYADAMNYKDGMGIYGIPASIDTGALFIDSTNVDVFMDNLLSNQ